MKKLFLKSLALIMMGLMCSTSTWATQMCGDVAYGNNIGDDYKVYVTSEINEGNYVITFTSAKDGVEILGWVGANQWSSSSNGNIHLTDPGYASFTDGKLILTIPSTTAPRFYVGDGVYLRLTGNTDRAYTSLFNVDLEACSSTPGPEPEIEWSEYWGYTLECSAWANKIKVQKVTNLVHVNLQPYSGKPAIRLEVQNIGAITACSLPAESYHIEGAGIWIYLESLTEEITDVTFTCALANVSFKISNEAATPAPTPTENNAHFKNFPASMESAKDITVSVDYSAMQDCELMVCLFTSNAWGVYEGKEIIRPITTGTGTEDFTFNYTNAVPAGNTYIWKCEIRPTGGSYANHYMEELKQDYVFTSAVAPAEPTSAPEPPTHPAANVKSIYSNSYTSTNFSFGEWGGQTQFSDKVIEGNVIAKFVNSPKGYFGWQFTTIDVSDMEYLHLDVWSENVITFGVVPINANKSSLNCRKMVTTLAGEWTSIDIPVSEFLDGATPLSLDAIYQIKYDNCANTTFWLDNVYFYTTQDADTEKPVMTSASLESVTFKSALINVAATDNRGVTKYIVKNGDALVGEFVPADGKINVTGLTAETAYTLSVYAQDAAGNVSDNKADVSLTTAADPKKDNTECSGWYDDLDGFGYHYDFTTKLNGDVVITFEADEALTGFVLNGLKVNDTNAEGVVNSGNKKSTVTISGLTNGDAITIQWSVAWALHSGTTHKYTYIVGACGEEFIAVTDINLDETEATLEVNQTLQLNATVLPATANNKAVTWEVTSGDEYVEVSATGLVTAKAVGSAVVTVKSNEDETITATCNITVTGTVAKTWWGLGTMSYSNGTNVTLKYSITRNEDKTLTYNVWYSDDFKSIVGFVSQINVNAGIYIFPSLDADGHGTATTEGTYETGAVLNGQFFCPSAMGAGTLNYTYTVGSENEEPSIVVTEVIITPTTLTMAINDEFDLTATAKPNNAVNKDIIWSLESGADVVELNATTGHIRALTAGTAVVKAATANGVSATCTITVVAALEPTVVNGEAYAKFADGLVAVYTYTITRTAERHVVVAATFDRDMTGRIGENNYELYINGSKDNMSYDAATKTATLDLGAKSDGETLSLRFRFVLDGGGLAEKAVTYTVGTSQAAPTTKLVSINEIVENADQAESVNVVLGRSFVADGGLYTLSLPFDMSADQIADAFGSCYIAQLTSVEERGADMLHLNFDYVDAIVAGVPYLFLPNDNITNPTINGVTLNFTPNTSGDALAMMHAVLQPTHSLEEGAYVLGADNYLTAVSATNDGMKGLRAYFTLATASSGVAPRAKVVLGTNTTTGMENATINHGAQKVLIDGQLYILRAEGMFNVQGQLVK